MIKTCLLLGLVVTVMITTLYLVLVGGCVGHSLFNVREGAEYDTIRTLRNFELGIIAYHKKVGRYPTQAEVKTNFAEFCRAKFEDGWKHPLCYGLGADRVELRSKGADGVLSCDDLVRIVVAENWWQSETGGSRGTQKALTDGAR